MRRTARASEARPSGFRGGGVAVVSTAGQIFATTFVKELKANLPFKLELGACIDSPGSAY